MTTYDNTNSGLLAKNDRKEKDSHPDYRGRINVNGQDFWLSAWIKVGREGSKMAGQKYFSLSVTPMEESSASRPASRPAPQRNEAPRGRTASRLQDEEDDIPF
jgi:hypothetical protein